MDDSLIHLASSAVVFSIPEYQYLQDDVCRLMSVIPGEIERRLFPDGERYQRIRTPIEGRDTFLIGGTISDSATLAVYDLACALAKHGARRLTLVIPYFGYSTMERAVKSGEVVVAKTRARLLSAIPRASLGNRALFLDLHSEGIPHYLEGGVSAIHVYAKSVLLPEIKRLGGADFVIGSTDAGRAKWVQSLANELDVEPAFVYKKRLDGEHTEVTSISARVQNRRVVLYDDMIRTGGSLVGAARAYLEAGAQSLAAVATHAVLPGDSWDRLMHSGLFSEVVTTDSHPRALELKSSGLTVVSVASAIVDRLTSREL